MSETLRRQGFRSGSISLESEDESTRTYSYANLCIDHFQAPNTSAQFSRKDLNQPLLKHTPESENDAVFKIWRTVVRFMTEAQDSDNNASTRSHLGSVSVSLRLSRALSGNTDDSLATIPRERQQSDTGSTLSGSMNTVRLKQLKVKLQQGLKKSATTFFKSPAIENSLTTSFEQAQYIIGWGLLKPTLRDEIYCMVLRQLTNNPHKYGRLRGWVLLNLIVGIFLPSDKIFLYVAKFIDDGPTAFSSDLKKLFVRLITDGPRHQPPSYVEYLAAVERKQMELQVTLMNGSVHSVAVDSSSTSSEVMASIAKELDLKERFGFSLFIAMENKVTSLGNESDKVFDAISQCEQVYRNHHSLPEAEASWRLFVRKEMFSPWDDVSTDSVATCLIYAQITRGVVLGEYSCETNSELATLAAKQYFCEFENDVSEEGLVNTLAAYVPPSKLSDDSKRRLWARQIVKRYQKLFNFSEGFDAMPQVDVIKSEVVSWAKTKWASLFSRFFDVFRLEGPKWRENEDLMEMAINSNGVLLLTTKGEKLFQVKFSQISSIVGEGQDPEMRSISGNVIIIILIDGTLMKFETTDANAIYRIISYSINGLKERSQWAIVTRDFDGSKSGYLDASEGDLLKLEQHAKKEVMTSLTAACTNMATLKSGRIPTELLHVIATLDKPEEDILRMFRPPIYYSQRSAEENCGNEVPQMSPNREEDSHSTHSPSNSSQSSSSNVVDQKNEEVIGLNGYELGTDNSGEVQNNHSCVNADGISPHPHPDQ